MQTQKQKENYSSEIKLSESEMFILCKKIVDDAGTIMKANRIINREIIHFEIQKRETNDPYFDYLIDQWTDIEKYFFQNQERFKINVN